jgi:hypothetical protein
MGEVIWVRTNDRAWWHLAVTSHGPVSNAKNATAVIKPITAVAFVLLIVQGEP